MKLTVLVDNNTYIDKYLLAEPGLSFYLEEDGKKILFDCGYSDVFIRNAFKLGIDLRCLDYVVFSHSHQDHTWGFYDLIKLFNDSQGLKQSVQFPEIVGHPEVFRSTFLEGIGEIGSFFSIEKLYNSFKLNLNSNPYSLSDNLIFLGEIPRVFDFENREPIGINCSDCKPDFMHDDSALALKTNSGIVIITACSHTGICNICEYAKKVCNDDKITEIIGGLHLLNPNEKQMSETLKYIKKLNLKKLYACHCTDLKSKIRLSLAAGIEETGSGLELYF